MNINLTLIGQLITFILFVWFSKKFVWAPIIDALVERRTVIADGLAAADKGQAAQAEGEKQANQLVDEAKGQAAEILNKAEKRGSDIVNEAKADATVEGDRVLATARAEIDTEVSKAKEGLRAQVSELAIAGAQQILKREVDSKAHADLLGDLAAKL
ncbi:MAG: F0F1 ATP synthase subunit B [Arenicellales bacterium]